MLERIAPAIFVFLWSTGFIGAKYGLPYAEPFTFLALRMGITVVLLALAILLIVRERPAIGSLLHSMVTGILLHGCYLGAIFWVIDRGMPAGVSALVVALQPLLTVLIAYLVLGERATLRQLLAFAVALAGVAMVIMPKLEAGGAGEGGITPLNFFLTLMSVVAISIGTVYQKRFVTGLHLLSGAAAQYLGAFVFLAVLSLAFETRMIEWTPDFLFALAWLVVVLSIGAVSLLMVLIRKNSSASTASLFYLVPVSTSVLAWLLFGETLSLVQLAGMAVVILAVARA